MRKLLSVIRFVMQAAGHRIGSTAQADAEQFPNFPAEREVHSSGDGGLLV